MLLKVKMTSVNTSHNFLFEKKKKTSFNTEEDFIHSMVSKIFFVLLVTVGIDVNCKLYQTSTVVM